MATTMISGGGAVGGAAAKKMFTIKNFRELYYTSEAKKYLSSMEIEQIKVALEQQDVGLLEKLYKILQQESLTNEQIVREFVMTKNKIVDEFQVEVIDIEKKYITGPKLEKAKAVAEAEQAGAEELLDDL